MKTKKITHTPGPWRVEASPPASWIVVIGVEIPQKENARANAYLIASSPEMHQRLVRLLEYLESLRALKHITGPVIDEEIRETRRVLYVAKGLTGKIVAMQSEGETA